MQMHQIYHQELFDRHSPIPAILGNGSVIGMRDRRASSNLNDR
jgi:hypothetical protein